MLTAKLIIATDRSYGVHAVEGILQIHFDQLNVIAKHLEDIKRDHDKARMANLPVPEQSTVRVTEAADSFDSDRPPPDPPSLIAAINDKMRIEVKHLGLIDRFNGLDIKQTRHYVKISCEKYLKKMIHGHEDLLKHIPTIPVPLPADSTYIRNLETATVPQTVREKQQLKERMGFNYRQVIGEIIFPMMKCRPEIAPHAIKLSQYMENPAELNYQALRDILGFLAKTVDDGIYYWRKEP